MVPVANLTSAATNAGSEIIEKYSIAEKFIFWELTVWVSSILSGSKAAHIHSPNSADQSERARTAQSETSIFHYSPLLVDRGS